MNKFKRFLAAALVLCMVLSFAPFSVFAAEETTDAPQEAAQLLTLPQRPQGGTTQGQPFAKGTGGSQNFRIPGLVTLDSGRLVASADARWNHTGDGAGLDTMTSWSDDQGQTWHYSFPNYLGDNGNEKNQYSTSFIDPALATDGQTVYMIADLFPAAIALNTSRYAPVAGHNGLDAQGRLLLRYNTLDVRSWGYATSAANADYHFYLENGRIHQQDGTVVEGFTVDEFFNITGAGVDTNLFCADSPYQPYPTNYLYLTTSRDGQTWSAPQLLNLKEADEQTLLVGPGSGTYDAAHDRVLFTAYEHTSGTERTSLLWRNADGTWQRSADANFTGSKSSEATAVVLADGTVRVFYRNMSSSLDYTDFTWDGTQYVPGATGSVSGAQKTQNNQLSALRYSQKADGRDLLLVSTAAGSGTDRRNGQIYAIAVNPDNTMELLHSYDVVPGADDGYDYSCLTEMSDGSIAMLWENDVHNGEITFRTVPIQDIVGPDVHLGEAVPQPEPEPDPQPEPEPQPTETVRVDLLAGESVEKTQNGLSEQLTQAQIAQSGIVNATVQSQTITVEGTTNYTRGAEYRDLASLKKGDTVRLVVAYENNMLTGSLQSTALAPQGGALREEDVWTFTCVDEGQHKFQISRNGKYVGTDIGALSASLVYASSPAKDWTYTNGALWQPYQGWLGKYEYYLDGRSNRWGIAENTRVPVTLYAVDSETIGGSTTYDHTITLQGVEAGHTTVTVGNVIYDVTVRNQQKTLELVAGHDYTTPCDASRITRQPDSRVAAAALHNGELVITAVGEGTTTMSAGGVDYTIHVAPAPVDPTVQETPFIAGTGVGHEDGGTVVNGPVTKLTLSRDLSYDLNLRPEYRYSSVTWRIEDPTVASVNRDGVVTGKKAGETRIIAAIDGVEHSIPLVVEDFTTSRNTRIYDFYASEITDTTVYYIWNNDSRLVELVEGEAIYVKQPKGEANCINFFGAPDEGYALTRMSSTNSLGHYFLLHTGDHQTIDTGNTGFVNGHVDGANGAGVNQQDVWGSRPGSRLYNSVQTAINAMCDGGMGFTRPKDHGDTNCRLTFRSEKLPTVEKTVHGVLAADGSSYRDYTEGMTAQAGEKVYYKITVTKYASQDEISYKNVQLKDILNGSKSKKVELFQGDGRGNVGAKLANPADLTGTITKDGRRAATHVYYAAYTITTNDLDTTLVNKADLTYNYKSAYSSGAFDATASAEARITATAFQAQDIVIDFGLPVTVHYDTWGKNVQLTGGTARYGTVAVRTGSNGWDVTYTPASILQGVDTVTLNASNGAQYIFHVYPATTVQYEESFLHSDTYENRGTAVNRRQEVQLAGQEGMRFGDTTAYEQYSDTALVSTAAGDVASAEFTGTGVDLYARLTSSTGVVMAKLTNLDTGRMAKLYQVDTRLAPGFTEVTQTPDGSIASAPIVSVRDLPFAHYRVDLTHVTRSSESGADQVALTGLRVYDPLHDLNNAAYPASERSPRYVEARDVLLGAIGVDDQTDSIYNKAGRILNQVYDASGTSQGAVLLGQENTYSQEQMRDLLDNGPKNELLLMPGQTIIFRLAEGVTAQMGLRSDHGVRCTVSQGNTFSLKSQKDLFAQSVSGLVVVKNLSADEWMSLTLFKYFGGPEAFAALTQEDMATALYMLYDEAPDQTAQAHLTISLTDYTGRELGQAELTAEGAQGESHTFTASQIAAAARAQLGRGYGLANGDAITDASVICGEDGTVTVQVGRTATLHVTYVRRERQGFFGPVRETEVGRADITVVQTSKKDKAKISGKLIRANAPEGCRTGLGVGGQKVNFGAEKSVRVTVR